MDFFGFSEPQNPPGTSKINEKPLVFLGFSLFSHIAQDGRKSFENVPKMFPGRLQGSPRPFSDPPDMLQDGPKMAPGRALTLQDAPKKCPRRIHDTSRWPKADQCPFQTPTRPLPNTIFAYLRSQTWSAFWVFSFLTTPSFSQLLFASLSFT